MSAPSSYNYRMKLVLHLVALLTAACSFTFSAPSMVLVLKSGLKAETNVSLIQRVVFSSTTLTVHAKDGKATATLLTDVQKITFVNPSPTREQGSRSFAPEWLMDVKGAVTVQLHQPSRVQAKLLNLYGKLVRELGTFTLPAGKHQIPWNVSSHGLASQAELKAGIYLLQVSVDKGAPKFALYPWMP